MYGFDRVLEIKLPSALICFKGEQNGVMPRCVHSISVFIKIYNIFIRHSAQYRSTLESIYKYIIYHHIKKFALIFNYI